MRIGFIGLGIMGSRMAEHLLAAGHEVVIWNRSREKGAALEAQGATWGERPLALAPQVDLLWTMLAHPQAVEEVALSTDGFLTGLTPGTLWIDSSTVDPDFSLKMAAAAQAHSLRFLDAPVAGSLNQAANKELVFFAGGEGADFEAALPLFKTVGRHAVHVGPHSHGSRQKLVVNLLLGGSMALFAEALTFGQALGLSREKLLQAVVGGPVTPPYLAAKMEKFTSGEYAAEFPLKWMHKDMQLVAQAAAASGAWLPVGNMSKELFQLAKLEGFGEADFSALLAAMEKKNEA